MKDIYFVSGLGLPQGTEKQDSEQFFRKVLGPSDGSALSGIIQTNMRPVLEGESNRSGLPLRNLPGKIKPNAHLVVCTCESSLTLIGYFFFFNYRCFHIRLIALSEYDGAISRTFPVPIF